MCVAFAHACAILFPLPVSRLYKELTFTFGSFSAWQLNIYQANQNIYSRFSDSDSKWFKVIQSNSYQFKVIQSETSNKWLVWLWQLVPFGGKLERWYLWKASIKSKKWFSEKHWFIWNFDSVIISPRFLCARVILVQLSEKVNWTVIWRLWKDTIFLL